MSRYDDEVLANPYVYSPSGVKGRRMWGFYVRPSQPLPLDGDQSYARQLMDPIRD